MAGYSFDPQLSYSDACHLSCVLLVKVTAHVLPVLIQIPGCALSQVSVGSNLRRPLEGTRFEGS